ncbi:hypothetical protein TruAng_001203 [Truncatella angustata]|nr:hypothetical protein TruAng_001203 [Truncatella angustata]
MEQDPKPDDLRERAGSSEPGFTRPNPFVDASSSSRKRRRTSLAGSRSRSTDTLPPHPESVPEVGAEAEAVAENEATMKVDSLEPAIPSTPPQQSDLPTEPSSSEPQSSKVTINLRNGHSNVQKDPASPSATKGRHRAEDVKPSVEQPEMDMRQPPPDASSSPSIATSSDVVVEPVNDDDDDDLELIGVRSTIPHVDITSILLTFPYYTAETGLYDTVVRLNSFFATPVHFDEVLVQLNNWFERYLQHATTDVPAAELAVRSAVDVRLLWQTLPELFQTIYSRRNFLSKNPTTRELAAQLLSFIPRLAAHLVKLDNRLLDKLADKQLQDVDLVCTEFLHCLGVLTGRREEPQLQNGYAAEVVVDNANLLEMFQRELEPEAKDPSMMRLVRLAESVSAQSSHSPRKVMEYLTRICELADNIASDSNIHVTRLLASYNGLPTRPQKNLTLAIRIFTAASTALRHVVEKSPSHLSSDLVQPILFHLSNLLRIGLQSSSTDATNMLAILQKQHPSLPEAFVADAVLQEWRFEQLTRMITSRQMQLRVASLSYLASILVYEWKKCQDYRMDGASDYLKHLSTRLTATGLVNYLLGPTCHPELIIDGFNIIGFLGVTETYGSEQTDLFWQTMTTTQDPRISDALNKMMAKTASHFGREALAYLVHKFQSLPAEAFTPPMRELCDTIILTITNKQPELVPNVAKFCLRLVQEASISGAQGFSEHMDTCDFAASKLFEILNHANQSLRHELLQECLTDISLKTQSTTGSLHVLFRLIRPALTQDLAVLVKERDFPRLLAEELEATITNARALGFRQVYASPLGTARRNLIEHIIAEYSASFQPQTVAKFWRLLVGEAAASQDDRMMGWHTLNIALKNTRSPNPVLIICLKDHLPQLSPELYCSGTLQFLRQALVPLATDVNDTALDGERDSDNGVLELLWQMILKALPQTIERQAIDILVNDIYVKGKSITSFPLDRARKVHFALVNRCLQQMADAAKALSQSGILTHGNEDNMITFEGSELNDHELRFTRSLYVLQAFLAVLQDQSHHFAAPDLRSLMLQSPSVVEGEPADLKVQSFDGDQQTDLKPLAIGRQNTAASLLASIREATGFDNYRIFYRGAPLTPTADQICKSLEELKIHNGLILVKKESDAVSTPVNIKPGASPLEIEILNHFKALWDYLSMGERLAKEVYHFLVKLPADGSILKAFESPATSYLDVFPLGEPFKCLYTIHALRESLNTRRLKAQAMQVSRPSTDDCHKATPDQEEALMKAMVLVTAAIEDPEVIARCPSESLQMELSFHLLETFVQLLTDSENTQVSSLLTRELQERMVTLLSEAIAAQDSSYAVDVANRALEALLECCSKTNEFWGNFQQQTALGKIIRDLLFDNRPFMRKNTAKLIKDKCTYNYSVSSVTPLQFTELFWPVVSALLPYTAGESTRCEESLTLSYTLMQKLVEADSSVLDMQSCIKQCGELILSYTCTEDVSYPDQTDTVARGLISILYFGVKHMVEHEKLQLSSSFTRKLFHKHLFPHEDPQGPLVPRVVLNAETRGMLTGIFSLFSKVSDEHNLIVLHALNGLVSYDEESGDSIPYKYDIPQGFERSKAVRAPGGHVGLRNLSNTCYLNSLFTQLFMNPQFRRFMMQVPVPNTNTHKLLYETQLLFSELQDSIRRSIDPSACVGQIMTYEETPIDIHTQMDVDEFYNLLFDRWESQMSSGKAKQKFRSIYGGQLVQQVKSKECEHISERIEPFSAIQCDIKGISSLQDSLQAYVDGEVMEGDNKYKCEKCNRHVDAVKRACLKEIPDNVIFHLKRFSFDLRTLQRNKINDHFAFPKEIDLAPFKVEHLSKPSGDAEPDMFELVGVLVHSGTAESGHYYSYIRERPSSSKTESWFEFNDDTVSPWDPMNLEGSCFGGKDLASRFDGGLGFEKAYSAYMLFYQRSSTLKKDQSRSTMSMKGSARVDLKPDIEMSIKEDNWGLVHRYCTNEPSHITFVKEILVRTWGSSCSHSHKVENLAMHVALGHLDQIASRAKDIPDFQLLYSIVSQACHRCVTCCLCFFDYFRARTEALRMLLLRNAEAPVRHATGNLLIHVLKSLKLHHREEYDPPFEGDEDSTDIDIYDVRPSFLTAAVRMFSTLFESFHNSLRAWPEFFHVILSFAMMGKLEIATLLEENYLLKLIMIVTADATDQELPPQYARLATTLFRRQRPPSYEAIISLIDLLMDQLDPDERDFVDSSQGRLQLVLEDEDQSVPYTSDEVNEIHRQWARSQNSTFVDKLIQHGQNLKATESICRRLIDFSPMMDQQVFITLRLGITDCQQNAPPVAVYLRAAVWYVRYSSNAVHVHNLIRDVVFQCRSPANVEGMAYLSFFKRIFEGARRSEPDPTAVYIRSLQELACWAPALIGHMDSSVREQVDKFLEEVLWGLGPEPSVFVEEEHGVEKAQELVATGKHLTINCLLYLQEAYVERNAQAPRESVLPLQEAIQCGAVYFTDANAHIHPELDIKYAELKPVIPELGRLMVDEVEEDASDWDNSVGSSEPIDLGDV